VLHAHCVQLTEDDCQILARSGGCVAYNPVSNMYLGSGVPPIPRLLELGVTVSLGADGAASNNSQDMLEAIKVGAFATVGGARSLGREDFGTLEVGKRADLFIFDPMHAKSAPMHDPVSTLVYASGEVNVRTTIVGGDVVLDDGRITGVDERSILREAQTLAEELAEVAGTRALAEARRKRVAVVA
jgi:5-methylthioadenosine/S-adenosylhomocysteine deaminase